MSYEAEMMKKYKMPERSDVEQAILITLFNHNGVLKEFSSNQAIVNEIAINFSLNFEQMNVVLERIYHKENRIVKSPLWHRLLYRAADKLANSQYISRPKDTFGLTNKKEWMLTEKGYNKVLSLLNIHIAQKEVLSTKSYEVEKVSKTLQEAKYPINYNPFEVKKKKKINSVEKSIRKRAFRQAVVEAYDYKCAVCGLKLNSPDMNTWEVQAAHIIPHNKNGKDDIWNGISMCHIHHWAFDIGWFTFFDNYSIQLSSKIKELNKDYGKVNSIEILRNIENKQLYLPKNKDNFPHMSAIQWHKENIFYK